MYTLTWISACAGDSCWQRWKEVRPACCALKRRSCHISSDVGEGSRVGDKSGPRAMMLSCTNITRKMIQLTSSQHSESLRRRGDWTLNTRQFPCNHFIRKTFRWSCKRPKKCTLLKQFVLEGAEGDSELSQRNRKAKVKRNLLRSMASTQQEETKRTEMVIGGDSALRVRLRYFPFLYLQFG